MKLLFAEDTKELSRAVCVVLEHSGYEVDPVYDGEEAMERIRTNVYDGVILDIMMPGKTGLEVLTEMRNANILTPVLMLTAKAEIDDRVVGLDAGADDYLTKPFAMKELIARVKSMTRRREEYTPRDMQIANLELRADNFEMTARNSVRLSIKEFELMQTLIMNPDRELDTGYLLEHVWANEPDATEDTVWLYISYLKGKLDSVDAELTIAGSRGGSFRLIKAPES